MTSKVQPPIPSFFDVDGEPLENGSLYIGTTGLNPESNPINVFFDEALTIPAAQPIKTIGGFPVNNGVSSRLYVAEADYSIIVRNKNGALVRSSLSGNYDPAGGIFTQTGTGSVPRTVNDKLGDTISVKDFGVVGDGVTDDYAALVNAITEANAQGAYLFFPPGDYAILSLLEMPLRVSGDFRIIGDIRWSLKKDISQKGKCRVDGTILLSGVWYSDMDYLEASGDITFDGNQPVWGTFWNNFGFLRCATLVFDVDQGQSVNQNFFHTVRCSGGMHIRGVNTTGIREAHNNFIMNMDTTGADMTAADGTTGVHVLNDSDLNQTNTIANWYAESSGSRLVKGNWMVLGANVDAINNPISIDRNNSALLCRNIGRLGNYLAASANMARGGDWSELSGVGLPISLGGSSISQVSLTDAPDGNLIGARQAGGATFRAHNISYPLTSKGDVNAVLFVREEGTPSRSVEIYAGDGSLASSGVASYTPLGNNWYLLRIKGGGGIRDDGAGYTTGQIRIYTTTSGALTPSDARTISSYYVSTEDTALLPFVKPGPKTAYVTSVPTAGEWNVGDEAINTAPTPGGVYKWVCTAAGNPGTWEGVIGNQDYFYSDVKGTIESADGTVTIATYAMASFSGRAAVVEVLARCKSGAGGTRREYRRSLINENGGGTLVETNLDTDVGANMALTFNLSGSSLQLQLASSIASPESFSFIITIKGDDAGNLTTINYS